MATDPTQLHVGFMQQYGPYAFGIVSLIILVSLLAWIWKTVFSPDLKVRVELAGKVSEIIGGLKDAIVGLNHVAESLARIAVSQERATERLERAIDRLDEHDGLSPAEKRRP